MFVVVVCPLSMSGKEDRDRGSNSLVGERGVERTLAAGTQTQNLTAPQRGKGWREEEAGAISARGGN